MNGWQQLANNWSKRAKEEHTARLAAEAERDQLAADLAALTERLGVCERGVCAQTSWAEYWKHQAITAGREVERLRSLIVAWSNAPGDYEDHPAVHALAVEADSIENCDEGGTGGRD